MKSDEEIRRQLRERLGPGARYDAPSAPAEELLWARRGTAVFARALNGLDDRELDGPSLRSSFTRRHVVAAVSFQARRLARLAEAARRGSFEEAIAEPEILVEDLGLAVTLPAHALRYLFKHSEVHLNVEWRDLSDDAWERTVRAIDGETVRIRETPLMRAQAIWQAAQDMDAGPPIRRPPELMRVLGGSAFA